MLELEKQVNGSTSTFQTVFLLAAITYPLGNVLCKIKSAWDYEAPVRICYFCSIFQPDL